MNIAQLWNMSKKTIIALAVLDTPPKDPVNAEIRVIKSVFCKDFETSFFSKKD